MSDALYVGIDVSKLSLAVAVLLPGGRFEEFACLNDSAGHKSLIRQLHRFGGELLVVFEATSTYGLDLALALHAAKGICPAMVNPRAAHDFASAARQRAKTDPLDARGLALFAQRMQPDPWQPPSPLALQLRALSRRMSDLAVLRTAEKNRCSAALASKCCAEAAASAKRMSDLIKAEILLVQAQALALLRQDPELSLFFDLLISVKGIAERSAILLLGEICCLPKNMGKAQWTAMAGLDPRPQQSGTSLRAPWHISRQGNRLLRSALFMPALVAIQYEPCIKAHYEHMLERGKAKRVAQCAIMRKLLCAIWGMLHSRQTFDPALFSRRLA